MKKIWKSFMMAGVLSLALWIQVFAGAWQNDSVGYWYQNDNGTYPVNCWQWIDGNNDGIAECYYFNENGYLLVSTITPDNRTVDANGAWTVDGTVQTQNVSQKYGAGQANGPVQAANASGQPQQNQKDQQQTAQASQTQSQTQTGQSQKAQASEKSQTGISAVPYDGYTIIVNTNSKKYHVPGCRSVKAMKQSNMGYASDAAYLESIGYSPCKNCH